MFAILGSGFGLYGYLPALVDVCHQRVVLPERYRGRLAQRPELSRFIGRVEWAVDEDAAVAHAQGLVVAMRPIDQGNWVRHALGLSNIKCLLLEKPLAQSPEASASVLDDLIKSSKRFALGYTFRHTGWGGNILRLRDMANEPSMFSLHWAFMAHHYRHGLENWKRFTASGGGAIRFYGIHLIALLAEIGYRDVEVSRAFGGSPDEIDKWSAMFVGPDLPDFGVTIDTCSDVEHFRLEQVPLYRGRAATLWANFGDPFQINEDAVQRPHDDQRVPVLAQLCRSLLADDPDSGPYQWYEETIKLWQRVEDNTVHNNRTENRL